MRKSEDISNRHDTEDNPYLTSNYVVTAPNVATAIGVGLVTDGVRRGIDTPLGFAEINAGKFMDVVDGWLARNAVDTKLGHAATKYIDPRRLQGSKSRRIADPVADRYSNWKIFSAMRRIGSVPKPVTDTILVLDWAGTAAVNVDIFRHPEKRAERRPDNTGKLGFALQSLAAVAFHLDHMMTERSDDNPRKSSQALRLLGWSAFAGGTALKIKSVKTYTDWARGKA